MLVHPHGSGWHLWTPGEESGTGVAPALRETAEAWASSCGTDADPAIALGLWVPDGMVPQGTARLLLSQLDAAVGLDELRREWARSPELEGARVLSHGTYLLSEVGHVGPLGDGVVESVTSADHDGGPVVVSCRVVVPRDRTTALVCEFDTFAPTLAEEFELAALQLVASLAWAPGA